MNKKRRRRLIIAVCIICYAAFLQYCAGIKMPFKDLKPEDVCAITIEIYADGGNGPARLSLNEEEIVSFIEMLNDLAVYGVGNTNYDEICGAEMFTLYFNDGTEALFRVSYPYFVINHRGYRYLTKNIGKQLSKIMTETIKQHLLERGLPIYSPPSSLEPIGRQCRPFS